MAEEQNVATPSKAFLEMEKVWDLPETLMGGTRSMREAKQDYLPQEQMESSTQYLKRIDRSVLFNQYGRTILNLTSLPFKKPVVLGEESDESFKEMAHDVDREGTELAQFARPVLRDLIHFGKAHILVDHPAVPNPDNTSLADQDRLGIRPYFCRVSPRALFAWQAEMVNGVEVLSQIRIRERRLEPSGMWGDHYVDTIRVITPTGFETWQKEAIKDDKEFVQVGNTLPNTLGKIPLVTIYGNRTGILQSEPMLEDLAWMNLRHWQSQSDQDNILHIARVPMLFAAGMKKDEFEKAIVSAARAIVATNPAANVSFVEHSGAAIGAGQTDLDKIEDRMMAMGARMLIQKPGTVTATEKAIDTAEYISELQAAVRATEMGHEQAFEFAGEWVKRPDLPINVKISEDFGVNIKDEKDIDTLLKSRLAGEIDRETYLFELKRRGILDDETDLEALVQKLNDREADLGGFLPTDDNDVGDE